MEIILNIVLVQNALSAYLSWCVSALILGAVCYFSSQNPNSSEDKLGAIFLSILGFIIVGEILEERYYWQQRTKYLVSHYCMYIILTVGILSNGVILSMPKSLAVCILVLIVAASGLFFKVFCMFSKSHAVGSYQDISENLIALHV